MASTTSPGMPSHVAAPAHGGAHARPANLQDVGQVHGIIMLVAFAILFPLGGAFLRTFNGIYTARIHGVWQVVAYCLAIAGIGTGLYCSINGGHGALTSKNGHKQIGIVVFIIMTIMPFLGVVHHFLFKDKQQPTWFGIAHRWLGRAAIIMGCINVGLGLMLGPPPTARQIAYAVVTGVCGTIYVVTSVLNSPDTKECVDEIRSMPNTPRHGSVDTATTTTEDVEKEGGSNVRLREM